MSTYEKERAEYEERTIKRQKKKDLCSLLDEVSLALFQSGESHALQGKVEDEMNRLKCKRKW